MSVPAPIAKPEPIEITQMPRVSDPRPKPASYFGLLECPSVEAFIIRYIGWKKEPIIGLTVSPTTVLSD